MADGNTGRTFWKKKEKREKTVTLNEVDRELTIKMRANREALKNEKNEGARERVCVYVSELVYVFECVFVCVRVR